VDEAKALRVLSDEDSVWGGRRFLHAAWQLKGIPIDEPTINRAVMSQLLPRLEAVSEAVTKEWRKRNRPDILKQQGQVVDDLQDALGRAAKPSKRVAAVRDANRALQRAELHFQDLKLEAAGQALGVEEGLIDLATELNRVRNRALGHAGPEEPGALGEWVNKSDDPRQPSDPAGHFGKAEHTAMAYVTAYAKLVRET
jgi:hypothetical protein